MNVAILSIDNLRYDCIGYQEDKWELEKRDLSRYLETANLDRFAEKSRCFTQCISTNTYTTASHASLFTGLYPPHHGVRAFYDTKLGPAKTLAERMGEAGYRTVFFSDAVELFSPLGLTRGFDKVVRGNDNDLFRLLENLRHEKVFLFCHLMDVHEPFMRCEFEYDRGVNADFDVMLKEMYKKTGLHVSQGSGRGAHKFDWFHFLEEGLKGRPIDILFPLYVKGVTKFDRGRFPRFLKHLYQAGPYENALTAVVSDHGEGRYDQDRKDIFCHNGILHDNVIRVPMMIRHPDLAAGVDDRLVSTVDLVPTLLSLLNLEHSDETDGLDAMANTRESAYSEHWISSKHLNRFLDGLRSESKEDRDRAAREWPEFLLQQRSMRMEDCKYIEWNRGKVEDFLDQDAYQLSNAAFVKKCYRSILGRFENGEAVQGHIEHLDKGIKTKQNLVRDFIKSQEYEKFIKTFPRFARCDYRNDREEDRYLDASLDAQAQPYFHHMQQLNAEAVDTRRICDEEVMDDLGGESIHGGTETHPQVKEEVAGERDMLLSKLKALGYF